MKGSGEKSSSASGELGLGASSTITSSPKVPSPLSLQKGA